MNPVIRSFFITMAIGIVILLGLKIYDSRDSVVSIEKMEFAKTHPEYKLK